MKNRILSFMVGALLTAGLVAARAGEGDEKGGKVDISKLPPVSSQKDVTYEKDIKPIFDKSCVRCHGAERPKGKLRLDSLEGIMKGGEDGKAIKPGDSAHSMLVINVAHLGDQDDYMPPPNNKAKIPPLTAEQIGLVRAWIDEGAK